jgi:hypothetical protein
MDDIFFIPKQCEKLNTHSSTIVDGIDTEKMIECIIENEGDVNNIYTLILGGGIKNAIDYAIKHDLSKF